MLDSARNDATLARTLLRDFTLQNLGKPLPEELAGERIRFISPPDRSSHMWADFTSDQALRMGDTLQQLERAAEHLTMSERIINWTGGQGIQPIIISGQQSSGLSTLGWQIIAKLEQQNKVGVMIHVSDLVMHNWHEKRAKDQELPLITSTQLIEISKTLETSKRDSQKPATGLTVIIDEVEQRGYNPLDHYLNTAVPAVRLLRDLGAKFVILNRFIPQVSENLASGNILHWCQILNPNVEFGDNETKLLKLKFAPDEKTGHRYSASVNYINRSKWETAAS